MCGFGIICHFETVKKPLPAFDTICEYEERVEFFLLEMGVPVLLDY